MFNLSPQELVLDVVVIAILLLISLPFHEFSHALAAYRLGDSTADCSTPRSIRGPTSTRLGAVLAITVFAGRARLGQADAGEPDQPSERQVGEAIVAAAARCPTGPCHRGRDPAAVPARARHRRPVPVNILAAFVFINILLMVFNFIPIPPLDGSKVLYAFLDPATAFRVRPMLEQYGPLLLLLLILLPSFGGLNPLAAIFTGIAQPLFGLLTGT
jgi:hypothetical protein